MIELGGRNAALTAREKWYRWLLALYPRDHRREHAEEMVGVLLAAAGAAPVPGPKPVAWALRLGQDMADSRDLIAGALRIRGRMALKRFKRARWFSRTARDQRWSDALAVVSVVAPLLLVVAAMAEFSIPQVVASSMTGHLHWRFDTYISVSDLPLAVGAPVVAVLAFLRLRRAAAVVAAAAALGLIAVEADPASGGYSSPAVAFSILPADLLIAAVLAGVTVFCLRKPVGRRVLALLAIPVIPYAFLWQEKLAGDLVGTSGMIPSTIPLLYLPPLILACLIIAGTRLARHRTAGRARQVRHRTTPAGPRGAVRA